MDGGMGQKKKTRSAEVNIVFMFPADGSIAQGTFNIEINYLKILPRASANSVDPLLLVN